ncbi:hypothetical protein GQ599_09805 [Streptococcus thermophilus]|nr:peritrophin-1-like [Procambarus clarkii]MCE2196816.1 hypothetical protein [Streptococcus thermophilus]
MKSLMVLIALSCAALVSAQTDTPCADEITAQCPAVDGEYPVLLPEPSNCRDFCKCSFGKAWLYECPPNTLYDTTWETCNWADAVDCGTRPIPEPVTVAP